MFKELRRATPQRAASEETRRQLLETALGLFRRSGFESTTMRDVAAQAGISLGAAYYYFPSKESIVGAYYDYVQHEHLTRAREAYAHSPKLRDRLRAALHTKIDIVAEDRKLLSALFRYGGDPEHPLSWFGDATRGQREMSTAVFEEAIAGERLPEDLHAAVPMLLWALHMGILLYFVHDSSDKQRRTRRLIDAATEFVVDMKRIATLPLLRPVRRRVFTILTDAGLLA